MACTSRLSIVLQQTACWMGKWGMNRSASGPIVLLVLAVSLFATACDSRPDLLIRDTRVHRISWDSLSVAADFEYRPLVGSTRVIRADSAVVTLYRATYDTLYVGTPGIVVIDDSRLLSRERILVEVCGFVGSETACDQKAVAASPKRVVPQTTISYPLEGDPFARGTADVDYAIQRHVFGVDDPLWEPITRSVRIETILEIHVAGVDMEPVRVPVQRGRTRLQLNRKDHFRDLRFGIQSQVLDADSAIVLFDLMARIGGEPERVGRDSVVVRTRSVEERRAELVVLVEAAGGHVLDELRGTFGLRRAYVFINDWSYQALERTFVADFELHWQEGFRSRWADLTARLSIRFDGTQGRVVLLRASDVAQERWDRKMDGPVFVLDALYPDQTSPQSDHNARQ